MLETHIKKYKNMKQILITAALILSTLFTQAQSYIRANSLSFGYKEEAGVRWTTENEPVNILITVQAGVITIYCQKTQTLHYINQLIDENNYSVYRCTDQDNVKCNVTIKVSKEDTSVGVMIVEYNNIIYFYNIHSE